jgi:hypothetical protein
MYSSRVVFLRFPIELQYVMLSLRGRTIDLRQTAYQI